MNNIKSYKKFLNERRLSNTTLYSAADKFSNVGHDRLAKQALDKVEKDEGEHYVDLIVSEYFDYSGKDFPTNMYDFNRMIDKNKAINYGKIDTDKFNSPMKHKFIEDARLVLTGLLSGDLTMLFTDEEEDKIFVLSLSMDVEKEALNGVQFQTWRHSKNRLAERKDIPVLINIVKQAYYNSSFMSSQTVRSKFHDVFEAPKSEDLINKIDGMFVKYKRSFYSDLSKNQLASEKTVDKYNL